MHTSYTPRSGVSCRHGEGEQQGGEEGGEQGRGGDQGGRCRCCRVDQGAAAAAADPARRSVPPRARPHPRLRCARAHACAHTPASTCAHAMQPMRGAAVRAPRTARRRHRRPPPPPRAVLYLNVSLLGRFVESRDARLLMRALRYNGFLRAHLPLGELAALAASHAPADSGARLPGLQQTLDAVAAVRPEPVQVCCGVRMPLLLCQPSRATASPTPRRPRRPRARARSRLRARRQPRRRPQRQRRPRRPRTPWRWMSRRAAAARHL